MRTRGIVGQEISEFKEISRRSMPGDSSAGKAPEDPAGARSRSNRLGLDALLLLGPIDGPAGLAKYRADPDFGLALDAVVGPVGPEPVGFENWSLVICASRQA